MRKIAIYLAGSIKKQHEKADESFWTEEHLIFMQDKLPEFEISFLNPAFRADDLTDQLSVFGRDMTQVYCSDLVFVDARDRRGLGVGAEMMWAKFHKIPLLVWAPKDTHYHRSETTVLDVTVKDFIHPFVQSLADGIVEDLKDATKWIKAWFENPEAKAKGINYIQKAMKHYQESQLPYDTPMKIALEENEHLRQKLLLTQTLSL